MIHESELLDQLYQGMTMAHSAAKQLSQHRMNPEYLQLAEILEKVKVQAKILSSMKRTASAN